MVAMDESHSDGAHQHAPNTVTDAVEILRSVGYTADFELDGDVLRSARGDASCPVHEAVVEHLYRFEGPSDPGDEMIVFGLRDPATGVRGTLATAFGHAADPGLARHLADLSRRFG
jgi:hypothetical protein